MLRILIGDDHAVFRRGLREVLKEHLNSVHIEESSTGAEMMQKAINGSWDLFLMDLTMPEKSGLELLQDLRRISPSIPILILSVHPETTYAVQMLQNGAKGYLNKTTSPNQLISAIQHILAGHRYITEQAADCLYESMQARSSNRRPLHLSGRESATLNLLVLGKPLKSIASELGVSVNTVSTYRRRLLRKLNLSSNAELIRYAIEQGWHSSPNTPATP